MSASVWQECPYRSRGANMLQVKEGTPHTDSQALASMELPAAGLLAREALRSKRVWVPPGMAASPGGLF